VNRTLALLFVTAVIAAIIGVVLLGSGSDDDSAGSGASGQASKLPGATATDAATTLDYLEAGGAQLLLMHMAALELGSDPSSDDCNAAAERLNREVSPEEIVGLSAGVNDAPLQAALLRERDQLAQVLAHCLSENPGAAARLEQVVQALAAATDLIDDRVDQLEDVRG